MRVSIRPALVEFWEIFRDRENTRLAIEVDSVSRVDGKFDLSRFRSKPGNLIAHGHSLPQLLGHEHAISRVAPDVQFVDGAAQHDSLRLRIHPAQARPNCEAALPFADHEARAPIRPEAHLRLNFSTGNERSSKGRAVAWPRKNANYRDVHTSRPGGETRRLGIGRASETALRALQGFEQVNRMARGSHFYVDQKAVKMIYWPGMLEAGSA
jgi:hypothetical protein